MLNVKQLRLQAGLSQQDLSEKTGIPKGRINNWEQDLGKPKKEDYDTLKSFFDGLEIKKSHLKISKGGDTDRIPFYDVVAMGGLSLLADQSPIDQPSEMINPGTLLRAANGALRVYGDSMFPKYPGGSVVAFKNSTSSVIVWGEDYVIELSDRRIVKRIEKSDIKDHIKAVSYNINKDNKYVYDPIDIPMSEVKRMYIVLGRVVLEASI